MGNFIASLIDAIGLHAGWYIAGAIVLVALLVGWRDFLRFSGSRIWAISGVCFSESIRRRVLWITPLAIVGVMVVSQLQRPFDEQDAIRQTTKFALFTTGLVVVIVGILLASTSLPKEIENRVIFTIVTKPTTRLEIVLGKTLGFARVSATILLIMGLFTAVYLQLRAWGMQRNIASRLEAGQVDPLSRPTLEHYRAIGLLNAKSYAPMPDLQFYAKVPGPHEARRYASAGDNQIVVPFDLTPEMFAARKDANSPFGMEVIFTVGYEKNPQAAATTEPAQPLPTTQPAATTAATQPGSAPLAGPSPLLSSTRPALAAEDQAPPAATEPAVAIGFLDSEETFLISTAEIQGGKPVTLTAPAGGSGTQVVVRLSPDHIEKIANAARQPYTRRVYFAMTGVNDRYLYYVDAQPARLVTIATNPDGSPARNEILPPPDPRHGNQPARPIFRGGYSRYGQQIKGAADSPAAAVYHFHDAIPDDGGDANFELRLGIDRGGTETAEEEDTITQVQLQVRDNATGQLSQTRVIKPETNRTAFFSFPRSAVASGDFDLIVRCTTPQHMIGLRSSGLAMMVDSGSFYANLFKSLLIFWLLSVLVVAVAICCSTFLSWPIAVVLCVVVLLGKWGVDQLGDATKPGIGAQVANDFGFRNPREARVVSESVETLSKALNVLARILPDITQFPATEDIERGVSIPAFKLLDSLKEAAAFGIPLLLVGYVFLKNKEVAP